LISSFWAPEISGAVLQAAKAGLLSVAGLLALAAAGGLPGSVKVRAGNALGGAVLSAALALIVGQAYAYVTGDSLWGRYSEDPLTTMNNGAAIVVLLVWPAAVVLLGRGQRLAAAALVLTVAAVVSPLSSNAALLALAMGSAVFTLALLWKRGVTGGLAGLAVAAILAIPWVVPNLPFPDDFRSQLESAQSSVAHRLIIWEYASEKIGERPFLGWGMDASRHMARGEKVMGALELMPLHPHNGALQVWLELGLPGALLMAALAGGIFLAAGRAPPLFAAAGGASAAGYLVIGGLSFGVWQTWWVAVAWILAIVVTAVSGRQSSDRATPQR
jgi:O-antigen ligase